MTATEVLNSRIMAARKASRMSASYCARVMCWAHKGSYRDRERGLRAWNPDLLLYFCLLFDLDPRELLDGIEVSGKDDIIEEWIHTQESAKAQKHTGFPGTKTCGVA